MDKEETVFKIRTGEQLERLNYLLCFKSKSEIAEILIDKEEKMQKAIDYIKTNELKIEKTPFVYIRKTTIDIGHLLEILESSDSNE